MNSFASTLSLFLSLHDDSDLDDNDPVHPLLSLLDALLSSMAALCLTRHHLLAPTIDRSVKMIPNRSSDDSVLRTPDHGDGGKRASSGTTPPAPLIVKSRQFTALFDGGEGVVRMLRFEVLVNKVLD
ncbi:uncharacterized protein LOC131160125 [Malania oleifera]|uniref:uncharacterized protein LOC131160125 n=1 Tax=Malania oleifera TaxID=397392 RepID=UPI0025AE618E|nr:uncharacterized protein LOC131160125 [Malania oleifera]